PKKAKNVSAGVLLSDGGKLFCTSYNITLDHHRESAVDRHLDSSIHRKRKAEIQSSTGDCFTCKETKKVTSMFQKSTENREARNTLNVDLTEASVYANIPFEKLDNQKLRKFFRLSVANGGVIPSSTQLRHEYVPKVTEYHKQEIMELVRQSGCLSVVTDKSTDAQDQYGLRIVFVLQDLNGEQAPDVRELKAVLADTLYLQAVN
ncbi:UNVERIFIED_CONTAM: hypothetical protein FKN15_002251, partial [Acipenser sinensis]